MGSMPSPVASLSSLLLVALLVFATSLSALGYSNLSIITIIINPIKCLIVNMCFICFINYTRFTI